MRRKTELLIGLMALMASFAMANSIQTKGEPIALTAPGEYFMAPKWSPSGEQVAVAGPSYTGLYLVDFPTGKTSRISDAYSAGYGVAWSHDGTQIAAKISHFDKMRRSHTLVTFSVADGSMETVSAPRYRMSGTPLWTKDDAHIYLTFAEKFESFSLENSDLELNIPLVHYINDGRFVNRQREASATRSTEDILFSDQDHIYSYAISPDGSLIVYSTAGQHLWLAQVNGDDRVSLGRGSEPAWSPDGHWITFMLTFDDGHSITASDIFVTNLDGTSRINITLTPERVEMNPQWSPDGEWIVYDTDRLGQLFVQQVEGR